MWALNAIADLQVILMIFENLLHLINSIMIRVWLISPYIVCIALTHSQLIAAKD